jgi:hypothetical protein
MKKYIWNYVIIVLVTFSLTWGASSWFYQQRALDLVAESVINEYSAGLGYASFILRKPDRQGSPEEAKAAMGSFFIESLVKYAQAEQRLAVRNKAFKPPQLSGVNARLLCRPDIAALIATPKPGAAHMVPKGVFWKEGDSAHKILREFLLRHKSNLDGAVIPEVLN